MSYLSPFMRFPSVYVVSDSELKAWKQEQTKREIEQLETLVEGHYGSIVALQKTIKSLQKELTVENSEDAEAAE